VNPPVIGAGAIESRGGGDDTLNTEVEGQHQFELERLRSENELAKTRLQQERERLERKKELKKLGRQRGLVADNSPLPNIAESDSKPRNLFRSCKEVFDKSSSRTDGLYKIDADGPEGKLEPFDVYCDMTHEDGGWTLYANHSDGIAIIQEPERVRPTKYGVMNRQRWQASLANMKVGMMFIDENGKISTISSKKLKSGNCLSVQFVESLTQLAINGTAQGALWHEEKKGCDGTGLDYSTIQLSGQIISNYKTVGASLFEHSDKRFDLWPYQALNSYKFQNRLLYFIK